MANHKIVIGLRPREHTRTHAAHTHACARYASRDNLRSVATLRPPESSLYVSSMVPVYLN